MKAGARRTAPLPAGNMLCTDGACILYSGGTTGTTKGILLSNLNFHAQGMQTAAASGYTDFVGLRMLSVMRYFYESDT